VAPRRLLNSLSSRRVRNEGRGGRDREGILCALKKEQTVGKIQDKRVDTSGGVKKKRVKEGPFTDYNWA